MSSASGDHECNEYHQNLMCFKNCQIVTYFLFYVMLFSGTKVLCSYVLFMFLNMVETMTSSIDIVTRVQKKEFEHSERLNLYISYHFQNPYFLSG